MNTYPMVHIIFAKKKKNFVSYGRRPIQVSHHRQSHKYKQINFWGLSIKEGNLLISIYPRAL